MQESTAAKQASTSPFGILLGLEIQEKPTQAAGSDAAESPVAEIASEDPALIETPEQEKPARPKKQWALVTHRNHRRWCTDAALCLWAMVRFVVRKDDHDIMFVPAGTQVPMDEREEGVIYEHLDTGGGDCDQHGKSLQDASSFLLTCRKYKMEQYPGLQELIALSIRADNIVKMEATDLHYLIRGLPQKFTDPTTSQVNWNIVVDRAFELFDIIYDQTRSHRWAQKEWSKWGRMVSLANGLKVGVCFMRPYMRDSAFEKGADIVIFTEYVEHRKRNVGPYTWGIQKNRTSQHVDIGPLVAAIRKAEMKARGRDAEFANLDCVQHHPQVPGIFFHDSRNLILCGGDTVEFEKSDYPWIGPHQLLNLTVEVVGKAQALTP